MHCDGCAGKIIRCVRSIEGVETVKADPESSKLTVVGNVDPTSLRDKLAEKAKKKVELLSPQPKKDNKADDKSDQKPEKKSDEKKPKEPPVTTAVLKVVLHCQGCMDKIHKTVMKTKGVSSMEVDKQKELVSVKGTMDAKALAQSLMDKLKRQVVVVQPKKEKEGEGEKKDGDGGGGGKKKGGGGGGGGDGGQEEAGGGGGGVKGDQGNKMNQMIMAPPGYGNIGYGNGYPYPPYPYGNGHGYGHGGFVGDHLHAPQMFSDENPNACSIM
ncbi:hypothetical protein FH972_010340 [Carpinus fangiana]|uniref:HMA domain-containing protein n=1 Tax=Carpinus fangiana TaxID=176857 RepID=A0A660KQS7_9ROSI|nr:hypothetical protein FH972_010340 [Carpinus fangiana]